MVGDRKGMGQHACGTQIGVAQHAGRPETSNLLLASRMHHSRAPQITQGTLLTSAHASFSLASCSQTTSQILLRDGTHDIN